MLRKYFRFNYQLLWSQQEQPAFTTFHNDFTADECLPFIINKQNEHPYFFKPETITKKAIDYISFEPRLITENNLHDDNRPNRYEQNLQEQQNTFTNNNYDEDDTNKEKYMPHQTENHDDNMILNINENNASEYGTPESTTSAQNISQSETSATNRLVRISIRIVSPRQNTHDPQSSLDTSPNRHRSFTIPPSSDEEVIQDRTQNITKTRDTSVNVLSPTRTIPYNTRNKTRSTYDPPSVPSIIKHPTTTIPSEDNHNNYQQTSSQLYDPFNYSFFSNIKYKYSIK